LAIVTLEGGVSAENSEEQANGEEQAFDAGPVGSGSGAAAAVADGGSGSGSGAGSVEDAAALVADTLPPTAIDAVVPTAGNAVGAGETDAVEATGEVAESAEQPLSLYEGAIAVGVADEEAKRLEGLASMMSTNAAAKEELAAAAAQTGAVAIGGAAGTEAVVGVGAGAGEEGAVAAISGEMLRDNTEYAEVVEAGAAEEAKVGAVGAVGAGAAADGAAAAAISEAILRDDTEYAEAVEVAANISTTAGVLGNPLLDSRVCLCDLAVSTCMASPGAISYACKCLEGYTLDPADVSGMSCVQLLDSDGVDTEAANLYTIASTDLAANLAASTAVLVDLAATVPTPIPVTLPPPAQALLSVVVPTPIATLAPPLAPATAALPTQNAIPTDIAGAIAVVADLGGATSLDCESTLKTACAAVQGLRGLCQSCVHDHLRELQPADCQPAEVVSFCSDAVVGGETEEAVIATDDLVVVR
jgi:hypothetical protein